MVNTTLARGHHAENRHTARNFFFLIFLYTLAVCPTINYTFLFVTREHDIARFYSRRYTLCWTWAVATAIFGTLNNLITPRKTITGGHRFLTVVLDSAGQKMLQASDLKNRLHQPFFPGFPLYLRLLISVKKTVPFASQALYIISTDTESRQGVYSLWTLIQYKTGFKLVNKYEQLIDDAHKSSLSVNLCRWCRQ